MLDLRLKYEGGGRFQTAHRLDFDLAEGEFEKGAMLRAKVMRPRSIRANNLFHALCEAAYENQRSGPSLTSWRALKDWLLVEAGHVTEKRQKVGPMSKRDMMMARALVMAMRGEHDYVGLAYDPKRGEFVVRTPASTAKLGQEQFGELLDKVLAIICTEIMPGMDPESILNEARGRTREPVAA
jgi:hypothetical protein